MTANEEAYQDGLKARKQLNSRFTNPGGHHRVTFLGTDYASEWDRGWSDASQGKVTSADDRLADISQHLGATQ